MSRSLPPRRWNDADRQAFRDGQRLRAASINGRRFDGPEPTEWDDDPTDLLYELRYDK